MCAIDNMAALCADKGAKIYNIVCIAMIFVNCRVFMDDIKNCKFTEKICIFVYFLKLFCLNFVNLTLYKTQTSIYQ